MLANRIKLFEEVLPMLLEIGFNLTAFRRDKDIKAFIFAINEEEADKLVESYCCGECYVAERPPIV